MNGAREDHLAGLLDDHPPEEEGGWLVTYADLVTLLLTFFVLLFAISSMDAQRFKRVLASVQSSLGGPFNTAASLAPPEAGVEALPRPQPPALESPLEEDLRRELMSSVQALIEKKRLGENIVVYQGEKQIFIRVQGQVFFVSGEAELTPEALPILEEIANILLGYPGFRVDIQGHTDNVPIATDRFPSNWELAALRATTVLKELTRLGVPPRRLSATALADTLPVAPNATPEGRARNRRVEFVLEKQD